MVAHPVWNKSFSCSIAKSSEQLFFQILAVGSSEEDEMLFEQLVIHATEIEAMFKDESGGTVEKEIKTNSDNSYKVTVSIKTDESAKL